MIKLSYLTVLLLLMYSTTLLGQDQISEEELTLDQMFMDANKEKLLGNEEKAKSAFRAILEKYPNNPPAAYELSRLLLKTDSTEQAIVQAELAVREDLTNKWYKIYLGDLYNQVGNFSAGVDLFDLLIESEPRNEQYYYQKAFFLVKDQKIKDALKVYDQLEKVTGPTTEIVQRRHTLYLGLGDFKKAAAEYEDLVERFPNNLEYLLQLAAFYEQVDDQKSARSTYETILKIDPDHSKATMVVASGGSPGNDDLQYLNSLKPVFEDPGVGIDLKVGKLMPLLQKLNEKADLALAEQLLQVTDILERVHKDDAKSYAASGDVLNAVGRYQEASERYLEALDYDDTVFSIWEQLQYALMFSGDAKGLAKYAEYAMDVFPNQASNYYHAALGNLGLYDSKEALSLLEQALLMSGKDKEMQQQIISAIGLSYTLEGDFTEAAAAFEKALTINENSVLVQTRYAYYLLKSGKEGNVDAILRKAEKMGGQQAIFIETKALALYRSDQFEKAALLIQDFEQNSGQQMPRGLELYGDILFKTGQNDQAVEQWNKALNMGSKSPLLRQKIANKKL